MACFGVMTLPVRYGCASNNTQAYYSSQYLRVCVFLIESLLMKRTFSQTLEALCAEKPEFRKNGRLNTAAIARATKINQSTVHRMLEGQSSEPSSDNAKKLCEYFAITREQLVGDAAIPSLDATSNDARSKFSAIAQKAEELPAEDLASLISIMEGLLIRRKSQGQ